MNTEIHICVRQKVNVTVSSSMHSLIKVTYFKSKLNSNFTKWERVSSFSDSIHCLLKKTFIIKSKLH